MEECCCNFLLVFWCFNSSSTFSRFIDQFDSIHSGDLSRKQEFESMTKGSKDFFKQCNIQLTKYKQEIKNFKRAYKEKSTNFDEKCAQLGLLQQENGDLTDKLDELKKEYEIEFGKLGLKFDEKLKNKLNEQQAMYEQKLDEKIMELREKSEQISEIQQLTYKIEENVLTLQKETEHLNQQLKEARINAEKQDQILTNCQKNLKILTVQFNDKQKQCKSIAKCFSKVLDVMVNHSNVSNDSTIIISQLHLNIISIRANLENLRQNVEYFIDEEFE